MTPTSRDPRLSPGSQRPRAAEFFAGIGLVGLALEQVGFKVIYANDVDPEKFALFSANFDTQPYVVRDIRQVEGTSIPDIELATASFPCTDLSLAGNRAGLSGRESSMFWEFARVLDEMDRRRPSVVLLENVPGFATSRSGRDLSAAIAELNRLGYACDLLVLDARWYVPQSRQRMFIVGSQGPVPKVADWTPSTIRPAWVQRFVNEHPELTLQAGALPEPPRLSTHLADIVLRLAGDDPKWWSSDRVGRFLCSLSAIQRRRAEALRSSVGLTWRTAYRRTRDGRAVWEIRADDSAGCLRTTRGGSSKQALVEAGRGDLRVRWLTPREYAALQGVPDFDLLGSRDSQAYFAFGDAVCVPVIAWIAEHYLWPLAAAVDKTDDDLARSA